ncbi:MAG: hypothetical protein ACRD09_09735 [Vicinamibacterales bacterium]
MIFVVVILLGVGVWLAYGYPGKGFLPGFAKLLDRPQIVGGFINGLAGRSYLTGEFRGRKLVILMKRKRGKYDSPGHLVVSMETSAAASIDPHDFAAFRQNRDADLALFALEGRHELRLTHQAGCLKALWQPIGFFIFPGRFEPQKWQNVLEEMHALAGSLERRAA